MCLLLSPQNLYRFESHFLILRLLYPYFAVLVAFVVSVVWFVKAIACEELEATLFVVVFSVSFSADT